MVFFSVIMSFCLVTYIARTINEKHVYLYLEAYSLNEQKFWTDKMKSQLLICTCYVIHVELYIQI